MTTKKKIWTQADVQAWFAGRVPDGWFTGAPAVLVDREEILVIGELPPPPLATGDAADPGPDDDSAATVAERARIQGHREDTRAQRMRIADEAELLWGRKVSWGARCGSTEERFTTQATPVMTRLRMEQRAVLDTLIDAGVARSRSEALAWCVRLVGQHQSDWIGALREAVEEVGRVRAAGPDGTDDAPADADA